MKKCVRCGSENNHEAKFCRGCGVVLEGSQGAATIRYKKHNTLLIGLGISVGIVIAIVIGLLFFLPPHNPLVGKWENIDYTGTGYVPQIITFFADGSMTFSEQDTEKILYETHDDEIILNYNGELSEGIQYSINGNILTLKENEEESFRYKKIQ